MNDNSEIKLYDCFNLMLTRIRPDQGRKFIKFFEKNNYLKNRIRILLKAEFI